MYDMKCKIIKSTIMIKLYDIVKIPIRRCKIQTPTDNIKYSQFTWSY